MKVVYFFRRPFMHYHHSIEELFGNIMRFLPAGLNAQKYVMKWNSKGLVRRILMSLDVIKQQGDVNHITGDIHFISYFLRKKRTLLTIHDLAPLYRGHPIKRKLIKYFWFTLPARRVQKITVISESIKQELLQLVPMDAAKVEVVHDCISPAIGFEPKKTLSAKPVLLHMGTMPNKNLDNVIRAIKGLDVRLIILGKLTQDYRAMLEQHGIDYENHFNITYEEVLDLYKKSDLVLFASLYEGFGLPILEANAIGRPVITSLVASMPEVGGDAAFYVNPLQPGSIREGILTLIENEDLREAYIQRGLENIKRFRPETIAAKYAELYNQIASNQ